MPRIRYIGPTLAAAVLLASCSSGISGSPTAAEAPGFSIAALLQAVPQSAGTNPDDGSIFLSAGDLNLASEQGGLDRPDPSASLDDQLDWAIQLTGVTREGMAKVSSLMPWAVNNQQLGQHDEFTAEVGWSLWQVDTFIDSALPPAHFSVLTGSFDQPAIEGVLGAPADGYWAQEGEDYQQNLSASSAARQLGQPLRMALQGDGTLAVSLSTPDIQSWLTADEPTMANDAGVVAVAKALDAQQVYSAYVIRQDFQGSGAALQPFDTVGIGVRVVDGASQIVLTYHHADAAAATANVPILQDLVTNGTLAASGAPVSDYLTPVDVSATDSTVTAVLAQTDEAGSNLAWNLLFNRESFFVHT